MVFLLFDLSLQPFEVMHDLAQAAAKLFDLLMVGLALSRFARDPAHQHSGEVQVAQKLRGGRDRRVLLGLAPRLEKQLGLGKQPLAQLRPAVSPCAIKLADLAGGQAKRRDRRSQLLTITALGARHGHQVLHRCMAADSSSSHLVLDGLWQLVDQRKTPGHPAWAPVKALCKEVLIESEARLQLSQQPALLDGSLCL